MPPERHGPTFQTLHVMFAGRCTDLALAGDEIAERIRALGALSPGSHREFRSLTSIPEDDDIPNVTTMIRRLAKAQESLVRAAREAFPGGEEAGDQATLDLLTRRMQAHEKTEWPLRSLLEGRPKRVGRARQSRAGSAGSCTLTSL